MQTAQSETTSETEKDEIGNECVAVKYPITHRTQSTDLRQSV
jgi:hypothetical protein